MDNFDNRVNEADTSSSNEVKPTNQESEGSEPMPNDERKTDASRGLRTVTVVLLIAIAVLLVAITALLALGGPKNEKSIIQKDKPQVVYLNNGQVYFGRIQTINSQYMLVTKAQNLNPDCTLGKEKPEIVVNRNSIAVWENLSDEDHITRTLDEIRESAQANGQCVSVPVENEAEETTNTNETNTETEQSEEETDSEDSPENGDVLF